MYITNSKKPLRLKEAHDGNEGIYYTFNYRPDIWEASKEYLVGDLIVPTITNGFYYVCANPGVSGASEPIFNKTIGSATVDVSIKWKAIAYNLMLRYGDVITASSWNGLGLTITNESFNTVSSICKVAIVDNTLTEFLLTNSTTVTRSDGKIETFDRSIIVPIVIL